MLARAARNLALSAVVVTMAHGADEPHVVVPPPATHGVFTQFANIIECLQKNYVYPLHIGADEHATAALREFVRSLDPDAELLTPDEVAVANAPLSADVGDIGLSLTIRGDYPTVIAPRDGCPAQKAGLLAGDQIVAIDGQSTTRAHVFMVKNQLRGPIGSNVTLRVLDPVTSARRDVTIERAADLPPSPAPLEFLGRSVVYFRVSEFTPAVLERLRAALQHPRAQKARGLILDLRNNPGGTFLVTLAAARLFLYAKADIVALEYSNPGLRTTFVSDAGEKFLAPMAVLVDGGTAGEAEIFAAALRDQKRARLVGTKTFGRGRLISQFPLPDGSALLVPTAVYLPPSKHAFNDDGLTPDEAVSVPRETERILSAMGFGSFNSAGGRSEALKTDPVLAHALELLTK
ncbi:MAG TPA: S41 family peptidase [Verrucomicrobiae bacterium]|nr:S41 family peptidase [Verrucomicrobiae bacterium]